ncbi:MAG: hypothetical protein LBH59_06530 [Planctomycetaceae bacterium]|nr:hypothetical protein [Planctomycetaceae bacterium]
MFKGEAYRPYRLRYICFLLRSIVSEFFIILHFSRSHFKTQHCKFIQRRILLPILSYGY